MTEVSKKITEELRISPEKNREIQKEIKNISDFKVKIQEFSTKSLSELSEIILGGAIHLAASDIHIEPEEKERRFE